MAELLDEIKSGAHVELEVRAGYLGTAWRAMHVRVSSSVGLDARMLWLHNIASLV